ncbi:mobilization protein [Burkholderiales bacterium GJ-E10]|nr:mobilization protein [Burkholderiales bacterium GJ-E10]
MIIKKIPNRKKSAGKAERITRLVDYVRNPEIHDDVDGAHSRTREKCTYAGVRNLESEDPDGQILEMIGLATASVRSKDPIAHYVFSWEAGIVPTPAQVDEAVDIFLRELGLEGHQAVFGLHQDTDNAHIHLAVNRIHPQTELAKDIRFEIDLRHRAIARIERAQGWKPEAHALYAWTADGSLVRRDGRDYVAASDTLRARHKKQQAEQRTRQRRELDALRAPTGAALNAARKELATQHRLERDALAVRQRREMDAYKASKAPVPERAPAPSRQVHETERATGTPSAERIAIDHAGPIIRAATSWQDLHEKLAAAGMRFERKGSGAILRIGQTAVKATVADRAASISKLEARFGASFEDADPALEINAPPAPAPLRLATKSLWDEYQAEVQARRDAWATVKNAAKGRRDAVHAEYKAAVAAIATQDWTGRGSERNQRRAQLASARAAELARIRADQQDAIARLRKEHPTYRRFADWKADRLQPNRHEPNRDRIQAQPGADRQTARRFDIRAFNAVADDGRVYYFRAPTGAAGLPATAAVFVDTGRRIDVIDSYGPGSLTAALQLAAQKFRGQVDLQGSREFREAAAREAVRLGLTVLNEDLQHIVIDEQRALAGRADPGGPDIR